MIIKIQKPTIKDVRKIQKVFYETWLSTYPNKKAGITKEDIEEKFKNRLYRKVIQKRSEDISNISKNRLFLIAKISTLIVGVCKITKEKKYNQLEAIYVLPDYQGKGIGSLFWEKIMVFFGTKKDIIVRVAVYNKKAIEFYKKLGFTDTGKRFYEERYRMPISGKCIPEMEMIIKARVKNTDK